MLSCILVVVLSFEFDLFVLVGSSCFFVILNLVFLKVESLEVWMIKLIKIEGGYNKSIKTFGGVKHERRYAWLYLKGNYQ